MDVNEYYIEDFQMLILSWYRVNGRHFLPWRVKDLTVYKIIIAEVLLQRTKAETINKFYNKFLLEYPSWKIIVNSDIVDLEASLKPIGLYRQRAKRLKDLATEMNLRKGKLPSSKTALEKIPFLGQYIVNAIELQVFNRPRPLLDVNMARLLERYFGDRKLADIRYDPYLQNLAKKIVNHPQSKHVNWAILDFASLVCKSKNPLCQTCLLSRTCKYSNKVVI